MAHSMRARASQTPDSSTHPHPNHSDTHIREKSAILEKLAKTKKKMERFVDKVDVVSLNRRSLKNELDANKLRED
jgi:hypothetical protein